MTPKASVRTVFSPSVFPSEFHAIPGAYVFVIPGRLACVNSKATRIVFVCVVHEMYTPQYNAFGCPVVLCFEER